MNINSKEKTKKGFPPLGCWIFLFWLVINYWDLALKVLQTALSAGAPLLIGLVIAYAVNIIMTFFERKLMSGSDRKIIQKIRRPAALLLAFLCLFGGMAGLIYIVFPRLWECLGLLAIQITDVTNRYLPYIKEWIPADILENPDTQLTLKSALDWLLSQAGGALNSVVVGVGSFVSSLATALIALIFSIYLLLGKEKLLNQCNRFMDLYFPKKGVAYFRYVASAANTSFHNYIVGQCTEAIVLGSLCAVGMLLFRLPYAAMIGCVVGITALIPFVGAYIGAAVGVIMILTVSPIKALIFVIFLIILQQLENNLIYPRVVGSSIGLPGIWVLAAITIGGGFGGIGGMMLGVPFMATVYQLVRDDMNKRRTDEKTEQKEDAVTEEEQEKEACRSEQ